jgi:hypothetical protein
VTESDDLEATEGALWALLEPYRASLEAFEIYGLPALRWPGVGSHDFFAGVRRAKRHVSLHLMPVMSHPETLVGLSDELKRHHTGKTTFTFTDADDDVFEELRGLIERCYTAYSAGRTA